MCIPNACAHTVRGELKKRRGALALQVGSKQEATAAIGAGCDVVIAQGIEAEDMSVGALGLIALLDQVLSMTDLPVVAARGISSGRAMAAALAAAHMPSESA